MGQDQSDLASSIRQRAETRRSLVKPPVIWVAGVDGCRGGWIAVVLGLNDSGQAERCASHLCPDFAAVLALAEHPCVIAVDIPIGLLDRAQPGGRACDRAARVLLGGRRGSSVFSPPARPALSAQRYEDVASLNGAGVSKQAFNILGKIREVDELMTPERQRRVVEAHPELAFASLAGGPIRHNKKTPAGRAARLRLLRRYFGRALLDPTSVRLQHGRAKVGTDDVLDACVLALVADRLRQRRASRVPAGAPPVDAKGLRMEIWF
jgi:predicted RNase H-like nuclease